MFERLADPCNDRTVKDVPAPPRYPMTREIMFTNVNGKELPDMKVIR